MITLKLPSVSLEARTVGSRDYRFAALNTLLLLALALVGLAVHFAVYGTHTYVFGFPIGVEMMTVAVVAAALILLQSFAVSRSWGPPTVVAVLIGVVCYVGLRSKCIPLLAALALCLLIPPAVQIANQWEKAVILRLGKFRRIRGPGAFLVLPIIDRAADFVDQRIRVTDFKAETTLTKDTVPVNVDAIAFWMVWDARKAVLEVEQFTSAVSLSAQTALRDAIGKHELAEMLSHRGKLGHEIQEVLQAKTNDWGITVQSVEIRDIIIPQGLEDAMSRQAQAERERQSRIILGTAETEIAEKFVQAGKAYKDNATALHLRAMNMVFEGLKQKGAMVLVPSSALETMNLGALGGLVSLGRGDVRPPLDAQPKPAAPASSQPPTRAAG
jgi:regulator of protease activity HflC (stomatin/prohibitin superfamily)